MVEKPLLSSLTCLDLLFPMAKTADLYHFSFKNYKHSRQLTYFRKWVIEYRNDREKNKERTYPTVITAENTVRMINTATLLRFRVI